MPSQGLLSLLLVLPSVVLARTPWGSQLMGVLRAHPPTSGFTILFPLQTTLLAPFMITQQLQPTDTHFHEQILGPFEGQVHLLRPLCISYLIELIA